MNRRTELYLKIIRLLSVIVLAIPFISVSAQSGRKIQEPQPTQTPRIEVTKQSDTITEFIVDPNADEYKLIFPTSYEGTLPLKFRDIDRAIYSRRNSFVEQLNNAGLQGYKFISAVKGDWTAFVKLDEAQYEYTWFETTSSFFFSKDGFEKKYEELSKQGYRLVEHFFIYGNCEPVDNDPTPPVLETCEYRDLFLLERKKGVEQPVQYNITFSGPGWKAKMGEVLTPQINEGIAKGLYPTHAFSKFEILLQQPTDKDEPSIDKPDVRIVTSKNFNWGRNDLENKVNELGKQSYRLALIGYEIAVMYRRDDVTTPISYIWLDAKKKDFEKQLKKLQEQGVVYQMTYPDKRGIENKLVFEQRLVDDGKRREYKALKFDFQDTENIAEKKVYIDLMPSSKETLNLMNKLVKEGFTVRDLFVSKSVCVLLERLR